MKRLSRRYGYWLWLSLMVIACFFFGMGGCSEPDYADFTESNNYALLPFDSEGDGTESVASFPITLASFDKSRSPVQFNENAGRPLSYFLEAEKVLVIPFVYRSGKVPPSASYACLKNLRCRVEKRQKGTVVLTQDEPLSNAYSYGNWVYKGGVCTDTALLGGQVSFFVVSLESSGRTSLTSFFREAVQSNQPGATEAKTTVTLSADFFLNPIDGCKQPNGKLQATAITQEGESGEKTPLTLTLRNASESPIRWTPGFQKNSDLNSNVLLLLEQTGEGWIPKWLHSVHPKADRFPPVKPDEKGLLMAPGGKITVTLRLPSAAYQKIKITHALFLSAFSDEFPNRH